VRPDSNGIECATLDVGHVVKGQLFLPVGGQWFCPLVAISFAL